MRSLIRWLPRNSREDWIRKSTTRRNGGWFCFAPISGSYLRTVTPVILSLFYTCGILASPTTEPGRRGWERRLRSLLPTPHFLLLGWLGTYSVGTSGSIYNLNC